MPNPTKICGESYAKVDNSSHMNHIISPDFDENFANFPCELFRILRKVVPYSLKLEKFFQLLIHYK